MSQVASQESVSQLAPPRCDELEVSLFGKGVGECVVIHVGGGRWGVIDSFRDKDGVPIALSHLRRLGVDVGESVEFVVITHWDQDHRTGLDEVVAAASRARVVMPAIPDRIEFLRAVGQAAERENPKPLEKAALAIARVFDELDDRPNDLVFALAGVPVWRSGDGRIAVDALAPSQWAQLEQHGAVARLIENIRSEPNADIELGRPNALSIVIWLEAAARRVLLGGDLEASDDPRVGWQAVAETAAAGGRTCAEVFKVPHHGSDDADDPIVWTKMLVSEPYAGITPYTRLANPRPTAVDCARILRRTQRAYVAGGPADPAKRPPFVKILERGATVAGALPAEGPVGQVTFRAGLKADEGGWSVSFDGLAGALVVEHGQSAS